MPDILRASPWLSALLTFAASGVYGFSLVCLLAQIFPDIRTLQLVVSFLPHVLVAGVIASLALAFVRPYFAFAGAILVLVSGAPFLLFSKYEAPVAAECAPGECLTVITANILERRDAMMGLSALAEREGADLISINEAVSRMTDYSYRRAFPNHQYVVHAAWENMPRPMGNPITLLSRIPIADRQRTLRDDTAGRAYIVADLGGDWQQTRVVLGHAMVPLWNEGLKARTALLDAAGAAAEDSETFMMMGDFNLTPWAPHFRDLPGKRAGDPRWTATWPTRLSLLGIPIDHIMYDGDLELVEVRVLESIGSDHLPVLARFRKP